MAVGTPNISSLPHVRNNNHALETGSGITKMCCFSVQEMLSLKPKPAGFEASVISRYW